MWYNTTSYAGIPHAYRRGTFDPWRSGKGAKEINPRPTLHVLIVYLSTDMHSVLEPSLQGIESVDCASLMAWLRMNHFGYLHHMRRVSVLSVCMQGGANA